MLGFKNFLLDEYGAGVVEMILIIGRVNRSGADF